MKKPSLFLMILTLFMGNYSIVESNNFLKKNKKYFFCAIALTTLATYINEFIKVDEKKEKYNKHISLMLFSIPCFCASTFIINDYF